MSETLWLRQRALVFGMIMLLVAGVSGCKPGFGRSGNNDLEHLTVRGVSLTPSFSKDEREYEARVSFATESVVVNAATDDTLATMTLNGSPLESDVDRTVPLEVGANTIEIVVTAENELRQTYTVEIDRTNSTSDNADLDGVTIEYVDVPSFDASNEADSSANYFVNMAQLTVDRGDEFSVVSVDGSNLSEGEDSTFVDFVEGANTIALEVTSSDESNTNNYEITHTRGAIAALSNAASHYIKSTQSDAEEMFGTAVAVSDDTLVVGVPLEDSSNDELNDTAAQDSGAVLIYRLNGTAWSSEDVLKTDTTVQAGTEFGASVSIDGNRLAIGAPGENSAQGRVYIYTRESANQWGFQASVVSPSAAADDRFGAAVSIVGNFLLVGAPGNATGAGTAFVFEFDDDDDEWDSGTAVVPSNVAEGDQYGASLEINRHSNNPEILVGAPGTQNSQGSVYVSTQTAGNWSSPSEITADEGGANDGFGSAVSIRGDIIAVGAPFEDSNATGVSETVASDNNGDDIGAVYLFERNNTTWDLSHYVKPAIAENLEFGTSLRLSAEMLAVGAPLERSDADVINGDETNTNADDSGAVYVYEKTADDWARIVYVKAHNSGASDKYGTVLDFFGENLAVGAPDEDGDGEGVGSSDNNSASNAGAVYIVR